MDNLILITNSFPFSVEESGFLRDEIPHLCKYFNLTIISRNNEDPQYVILPKTVSVYRYNSRYSFFIPWLIRSLCHPYLYKELRIIIHQGFSFAKFMKAVRVLMRAMHFSSYINKVRHNQYAHDSVLFYTYWNDYSSLSSIFSKRVNDVIVTRLHGGDLYKLPYNIMYQCYKTVMAPHIDRYYFISNAGKKYFEDTFCDLGGKAFVSRLGTKARCKYYEFTDRKSLKIYSFSYVRDIKRIDRIIDTLSLITDINVYWVHIGANYLFEQKFREGENNQGGNNQGGNNDGNQGQ